MKKINKVVRIKLKHEPDGVVVTLFNPEPIFLGKFHQFSLNSREKKKPFEKEYMLGEEIIDFYEPVDLRALILETRKLGIRKLNLDVL